MTLKLLLSLGLVTWAVSFLFLLVLLGLSEESPRKTSASDDGRAG